MKIEVRGKNLEVTPTLSEYASTRISKLEKYVDQVESTTVTMSIEGEKHKVEVTIALPGFMLRGEEIGSDMYTVVMALVTAMSWRHCIPK